MLQLFSSPNRSAGLNDDDCRQGEEKSCSMSLARSCDVIVIGGGAAGTAAAVGAAKAGAQTLLVESGPFLWGAATLKNVLTYCGLFTNYQKKQAVFGGDDHVVDRLPGS